MNSHLQKMSGGGSVNFSSLRTREMKVNKAKVHTVGWSCDGRWLASGSADSTCRVWNIEKTSQREGTELKGHAGSVDQLIWDPNNSDILATASQDKTVRVWDVRSSQFNFSSLTKSRNLNYLPPN